MKKLSGKIERVDGTRKRLESRIASPPSRWSQSSHQKPNGYKIEIILSHKFRLAGCKKEMKHAEWCMF
jgi:hypothetical protein